MRVRNGIICIVVLLCFFAGCGARRAGGASARAAMLHVALDNKEAAAEDTAGEIVEEQPATGGESGSPGGALREREEAKDVQKRKEAKDVKEGEKVSMTSAADSAERVRTESMEKEGEEAEEGERSQEVQKREELSATSVTDSVESLRIEPQEDGDWVAELFAAQNTDQILVVAASGSSAVVTLHNRNEDGSWSEILSTDAEIGKNGIGKSREGDGKTPTGLYGFTFAFGIQADPGTAFPYTQVDDSYYWVDDSDSAYYNQFVSTNQVECDWDSAEHIAEIGQSYDYVLAVNYNAACVPGAGSAIFLHCKPTGGAGCIAVSKNDMIRILQNVQPGCVLIIDSESGVYAY